MKNKFNRRKEVCFWTLVHGEQQYYWLAKGLFDSLRKCGYDNDLIIIMDIKHGLIMKAAYYLMNLGHRPPRIILYEHLDNFLEGRSVFMLKIHVLEKIIMKLGYKINIFLDSDSYCLRKSEQVEDILDIVEKEGVFAILETNLNDNNLTRKAWHGVPTNELALRAKEIGINKPDFYNLNGGFFAVRNDVIERFCDLCYFAYNYFHKFYPSVTEEIPLACTIQKIVNNNGLLQLNNWKDFYITISWEQKINLTKMNEHTEFTCIDYFNSNYTMQAKPSIIHLPRSKYMLSYNAKPGIWKFISRLKQKLVFR